MFEDRRDVVPKLYRRLEVPGQARGRLVGKPASGIPEVTTSSLGSEVSSGATKKSVGS